MKIELDVSGDNESTESPWWMIISPRQNLSTGEDGVCNIAGMITGPFFSRESATHQLEMRRYHYGHRAVVWCASGYDSYWYKTAYRAAERKAKEEKDPSDKETQTA